MKSAESGSIELRLRGKEKCYCMKPKLQKKERKVGLTWTSRLRLPNTIVTAEKKGEVQAEC